MMLYIWLSCLLLLSCLIPMMFVIQSLHYQIQALLKSSVFVRFSVPRNQLKFKKNLQFFIHMIQISSQNKEACFTKFAFTFSI
jgi:hypothetical protein